MRLTWKQNGGWFDREYAIVEGEEEEVIEKLGEDPTLIELREAERRHKERIDLWQTGLLCSECGNEINGRFGATPSGKMLCRQCAERAHSSKNKNIVVNTDLTKAIISESDLHKKSLCDYVINVATGCKHGCEFCYVPTTPGLNSREEMLNQRVNVEDVQEDWGSYLLYRDDLPERLRTELETKRDWKCTERGRGVVMLSSGTDCYQDQRASQITRACIQELISHDKPVRVLTRSPAVLRDVDLFKKAGELVSVGSSIPTMDDRLARAMEPQAPPPSARWRALDDLRKKGVPRFVSMSPTYPTMGENEIWNTLTYIKCLDPDVVFHEPINPRGKNFKMCVEAAKDAGKNELAKELATLKDHEKWVEYALEQITMVREIANEIGGLNIHTWPDRELINSTTGELRFKLSDMKGAVSPESFGQGSQEETKQPEITTEISQLDSYIRN